MTSQVDRARSERLLERIPLNPHPSVALPRIAQPHRIRMRFASLASDYFSEKGTGFKSLERVGHPLGGMKSARTSRLFFIENLRAFAGSKRVNANIEIRRDENKAVGGGVAWHQ